MQDSITRERWRTIEPLLDEVLGIAPERRAAWLAERCGGDTELREAVERLAGAYADAQRVLPSGAPDAVEALVRLAEAEALPQDGRIGPYRIVGEAGRGGMGVVYLAERADDQYRKRVALKLLRRGMDDPHLVRRFLEERQILATLDHPQIARLLDGGVTGDRLPWFALEYVEGEPIDRYCDARGLPVDDRLRLFLAVCDAVQYAHRNLIVHRDLKPSNVLVTAEGAVKLLDFGIAKLLPDGDATEATVTQIGRRALTPEYASPEQIRGEPVTVASDVYSLGVMLYLLLSARSPYRPERRREREIERAVLEEAVEPPSAAGPPERRRRLRGDLDVIVLTALRKEPGRRYQGVEALAADLRRHLAGLPVQAQPDRWSYRAAKFFRRHTVGAAVAGGAVALLAGFGVVLAIQTRRTAAERERAEQVSAFVTELLRSPDPFRGQGAEVTVRQVLDSAVLRIRSELGTRPVLQADLLAVIGRSYEGLGLYDQAGSVLDSAMVLRLRAGDDGRGLAEDQAMRAALLEEQNSERPRADSLARAALRTGRRVLAHDDPALGSLIALAAPSLAAAGQPIEAESLLVEAVGILRGSRRTDPLELARALRRLGRLRFVTGDVRSVDTLYREALALSRARLGPEHPDVGELSADLGDILRLEGKPEAERYLREGIAIEQRAAGADHPEVMVNVMHLADLLQGRGELAPAESLYREAIARGMRLNPAGHLLTGEALFGLAQVELQQGDTARAVADLQRSLDIAERIYGVDHRYMYGSGRIQLAEIEIGRRDFAGAELILRDVFEVSRRQWGLDNARTQRDVRKLVKLYQAWSKPDSAETYRHYLRDSLPIN
jgi:serine/threonine-protein kinase